MLRSTPLFPGGEDPVVVESARVDPTNLQRHTTTRSSFKEQGGKQLILPSPHPGADSETESEAGVLPAKPKAKAEGESAPDVCGALGCRRDDDLRRVRLADDPRTRVLCPTHTRDFWGVST